MSGPLLPPAADLIVQPEPKLDPSALNSDKALNDFQAAYDAWAEGNKLQIGRICRWAVANGAKVSCPKAE